MSIADELRKRVEGEVRFDKETRLLYSTDASIYQIEPIGVVIPRHAGDVEEVVRFAALEGVPVLPRGGGTSLAGQAVGEAIVLDFSKYMNAVVEVSREESWVRVQPGVVHDVLGAHLKPYGLRFGPETATSNRANIGGMIGNNSAGARSLIYGKTVENVHEVTAVLADGSRATFGPVARKDLASKVAGDTLEAGIYRRAVALGEKHREEIDRRYPKIPRRVSGYNLDELLDPDVVNLAKLLVGSEGTLAAVVEAKLALAPIPKVSALAVLHFDGLLDSLETGTQILELEPSAVELVDEMVMNLARKSLEYSRRMHFVQGQPKALSWWSSSAIAKRRSPPSSICSRRVSRIPRSPWSGCSTRRPRRTCGRCARRRCPCFSGFPATTSPSLSSRTRRCRPTACPISSAASTEILADHDTVGSFYAHAGAGCLHIRPLVNLKDEAEVKKMTTIAEEVFELVIEFGGSMSGEHGDGLARSHFNERLFGDEIYGAFRELKAAFDPKGILNPGKVVDAPPMTENLRYGGSYRTTDFRPCFPTCAKAASPGPSSFVTARASAARTSRGRCAPRSWSPARRSTRLAAARTLCARSSMGGSLPRRCRARSSARSWTSASPARAARRSAPRTWTWRG